MSRGAAITPYREAEAPPSEICFKLALKPVGWKKRIWRRCDDSVMIVMRLDAPLNLRELAAHPLRDALAPFERSLRKLDIYCERGASVPIPLPWSIGRVALDPEHATVFLHRVLDDPFGLGLLSSLPASWTEADVTLSISPYEVTTERVTFAVRDYDIGFGGGSLRSRP